MIENCGCKCQGCGRKYKVDIIVPDVLWEKIKPANKLHGAGLLCGVCIMRKIEELDNYDVWELRKSKKDTGNKPV